MVTLLEKARMLFDVSEEREVYLVTPPWMRQKTAPRRCPICCLHICAGEYARAVKVRNRGTLWEGKSEILVHASCLEDAEIQGGGQ